eukprot:TRINITY_DN20083_c0_g2_i1.p1 TRINITY_DN20083_c0_g2~~TRINITY_DN20083_c0_g2_i1.p1  ORF type:complete len:597 (+),score=91.61 TRINITY_DN20083_c0_g2_i1:28-1791(+)
MDEKPFSFESSLYEEDENNNTNNNANNHGWQKVIPKRQRKAPAKATDPGVDPEKFHPNGNVFRSVEQHADERRRRAVESLRAEAAAAAAESALKSKPLAAASSDDSDSEIAVGNAENGTEPKKPKQKKPKKPKVTVVDAASKIDVSDLAAHLVDISASYESKQDIQLMRFADYFARAFSSVSASQFPWVKIFKESTIAKIIDVPVCHLPEAVYKTSLDWIGQRSTNALCSFVYWSLDSILADLANQRGPVKGSKKSVQQPSSKAQVAIFVVIAMVLRRKPDVLLITLLQQLRESSKYQGQDKLPVFIWLIAQASQGDLTVGMHAWVYNLLPLVCGKSSCSPHSRDLVLQLAERILSNPKAKVILVNGAVRKGERLVPPSRLDQLMRATFPSVRVKATERLETIYPTLKEVALTGSPGSKVMKNVSYQLLPYAVKAMTEYNPKLSKEAAGIFIWCLAQNTDCYKQWEELHLENVEASVSVLRKLSDEWKEHSVKLSPLDTLKETLKSIKLQNDQALADKPDYVDPAAIKDANKYCSQIIGKSSRFSCMKSALLVVLIAIVLGFFISSTEMKSWDWEKLYLTFSSPGSF